MPKRHSDIEISSSGSGFYGIHGVTDTGREWIDANVQDAYWGTAWCDDSRYVDNIVNAAFEDGLEIE